MVLMSLEIIFPGFFTISFQPLCPPPKPVSKCLLKCFLPIMQKDRERKSVRNLALLLLHRKAALCFIPVVQLLNHVPFLWSQGLQPIRLLCPCGFPGKNTEVGCHFLLQGIFLIQGLNLCLLDWQANSFPLKYQESSKPGLKSLSFHLENSFHVPLGNTLSYESRWPYDCPLNSYILITYLLNKMQQHFVELKNTTT